MVQQSLSIEILTFINCNYGDFLMLNFFVICYNSYSDNDWFNEQDLYFL